ncbi:hypothetical protein [Bradyrhizobium jicamae]|nr:hypothetical protein [Bradyrhizobium jicamae]
MTQGNLLPTLDWFTLHDYFAADGRRADGNAPRETERTFFKNGRAG